MSDHFPTHLLEPRTEPKHRFVFIGVPHDAATTLGNPGEAPGTGWPEPGGLTGQQLIDFVRQVAPHASAVDICELNPVYDTRQQTTTILAARILFDCIVAKITAPPTTKGDGDEKNL